MANILMLEPDSILARTYMEAFEIFGHETRQCVSAQEAVFQVDTLMPDVILVELQLVAHSGIEFLYELRSYAEWQHIPIIVHSCIPPIEFQDSMQLLKQFLKVQTYLYKPHTTLQALLREIHTAVGASSSKEIVQTEDGLDVFGALSPQVVS